MGTNHTACHDQWQGHGAAAWKQDLPRHDIDSEGSIMATSTTAPMEVNAFLAACATFSETVTPKTLWVAPSTSAIERDSSNQFADAEEEETYGQTDTVDEVELTRAAIHSTTSPPCKPDESATQGYIPTVAARHGVQSIDQDATTVLPLKNRMIHDLASPRTHLVKSPGRNGHGYATTQTNSSPLPWGHSVQQTRDVAQGHIGRAENLPTKRSTSPEETQKRSRNAPQFNDASRHVAAVSIGATATADQLLVNTKNTSRLSRPLPNNRPPILDKVTAAPKGVLDRKKNSTKNKDHFNPRHDDSLVEVHGVAVIALPSAPITTDHGADGGASKIVALKAQLEQAAGRLDDCTLIESAYAVKDLTPHDILCGPDLGIFPTAGKKFFERLVRLNQERYRLVRTKPAKKLPVVHQVYMVVTSLTPPGRFKAYHAGVGWIDLAEEPAKTFIDASLSRGIPGVTAWMRPIPESKTPDVAAAGDGSKRRLESSTGTFKKRKHKSSHVAAANGNPRQSAIQFSPHGLTTPIATLASQSGQGRGALLGTQHYQEALGETDPRATSRPRWDLESPEISVPNAILHHSTPNDSFLRATPTRSSLAVQAHLAELRAMEQYAPSSTWTLSHFVASGLASVPPGLLLGSPPAQATSPGRMGD